MSKNVENCLKMTKKSKNVEKSRKSLKKSKNVLKCRKVDKNLRKNFQTLLDTFRHFYTQTNFTHVILSAYYMGFMVFLRSSSILLLIPINFTIQPILIKTPICFLLRNVENLLIRQHINTLGAHSVFKNFDVLTYHAVSQVITQAELNIDLI